MSKALFPYGGILPWILFCKEQRHGGILLMYFWIMEERVVLYMLP
jgi:hypothetical protein